MNQFVRQQFADAQAAYSFVIAQGRNIETRIYQRRYPTLNYGLHVPVVTEGNEWASGTTFFTVDSAGEAKFLSAAGTDMPFNQSTRDSASHDFAMIGSLGVESGGGQSGRALQSRSQCFQRHFRRR